MSFLDQLNARLAVKKQVSMTALDRVSLAAATQATLEHAVLKSGIKGMHKGVHNALANLHKRADVETANSQRLMAGNYPTGYHASQSNIHEDLADAYRSHGIESTADYHDRLAVAHDKKAGGDGSGLRQNKVAKADPNSFEEVFKGLGKGSGRGRPKGSKNGVYQSGPKANKPAEAAKPEGAGEGGSYVAPKPNVTGDAGTGHSAEDVQDAFTATGKDHFGGTSFTPNVIMHTDKAKAELHEGAMHGHLQDSGFQAKKVHNENGIISTEYEHPNGTKVLLNAGKAGSTRHFVGYHHSTPEDRAADFGGKPKAKESDAPKAATTPAPAPAATAPKAVPLAAKPNPSAIGADGKVDVAKFKKGLKKVANLTDINDHNMALHHGAKLVGRDDIADKAKAISKQHLKQGHMSDDLIKQRSALHYELAAHAKKVLSPEQAHALHMSY